MRVVKFIILDILFIFVFCCSFLFNTPRSGDLRVNILICISMLYAAFFFELFYLICYSTMLLMKFYDERIHLGLFSAFIVFIHYTFWQEEAVFNIKFYTFLMPFSIITIYLYWKVINSIKV
jgi:hypothetical protein